MSKPILITGATGKQGGAVIEALSNNSDFTLLAVTRNPSSGSAQKLASKASNIKVVQGDLDDVPGMFNKAAEVAGQPLWGVYSVQISQGNGATSEGEIRSVERGGDEKSWESPTPIEHFRTKLEIEQHLKAHAGQMGWTVLRPVAFMENLAPGFPARVFMAALHNSLGDRKPLQWVAVHDIGVFAAKAFQTPSEYNHKAIGLAGDELTVPQIAKAFENATGSSLVPTFRFLGSLLSYIVSDLGVMVKWFGTPRRFLRSRRSIRN